MAWKVELRLPTPANTEKIVLDTIARDPKVRAAVTSTAHGIVARAVSNLDHVGGDAASLARSTAEMITVLPVTDFVRQQHHRGTLIPVALVASNSRYGRLFEYGSTHGRIPMTRFMYTAARVAARGAWIWRGWGRK